MANVTPMVAFSTVAVQPWAGSVSGYSGFAAAAFATVVLSANSAFVVNSVPASFATVTVTTWAATGLGIIIPIGYVEMSDTPGIYVKVADGFLLGPNYGGAV